MTELLFPLFFVLRMGGQAMANDYKVSVRIRVTIDEVDTLISNEETIFEELSFRQMTRASSEYYELLAKIVKAVK